MNTSCTIEHVIYSKGVPVGIEITVNGSNWTQEQRSRSYRDANQISKYDSIDYLWKMYNGDVDYV